MADINKLLEKANKYLQKQKFESALETFQEIYKYKPDDEDVLLNLSELSLKVNRTQEGLRYQSQLLDFYIKHNNTTRAVVTCRKILKLSPQDVATTSKLGSLLEQTGKSREALDTYREALALCRKAGSSEQAIECLKHIVKLDPENFDMLLDLAESASQMGQTKVASPAFLRAAQVARRAGTPERWAELVERAHKLDPADEAVSIATAEVDLYKAQPAPAVALLEPIFAKQPEDVNVLELLTQAYLAAGNYAQAEPLCWNLYKAKPEMTEPFLKLLEGFLQNAETEKTLALASKLKDVFFQQGKANDFLKIMEKTYESSETNLPMLEMLCNLYNELNKEDRLRRSLTGLFNLYVAGEEYLKAADTLERIIDVNPYGEGHPDRLLNLEGHIDLAWYKSLATRLNLSPSSGALAPGGGAAAPKETEDLGALIVEGEMYRQYQLTSKLMETLEKINRRFPGAEEDNQRLRDLYAESGFKPTPAPGAATPPIKEKAVPAPAQVVPQADDLRRISAITANLFREPTLQGVMHVAVSQLGRALNASRCWGGLGSAGRPPELTAEYCSPETSPSNAEAAQKLYTTLFPQAAQNPEGWSIDDVTRLPALAPAQTELKTLGIKSLLALALFDKEEPAGLLLMEQCEAPRAWTAGEILLLKAIGTQVDIALNNLRLRHLVRSLAGTDPETGLLPRSSYLGCLLAEARRSKDQGRPLSICLLEPRDSTALQKVLGDAGVQRYVQQVSKMLLSSLRQNDIAVRYSPLAVAAVLPDTDLSQSGSVAEKVCQAVSQVKLPGAATTSFHAVVCEVPLEPGFDAVDGVTEVVNRLEAALERARQEGKAGVLVSTFES